VRSPTTAAALRGIRDALPLALGVVPFGLVFGVAVAESPVPDWAGWLSSSLIFGGAAQLAAVSLLAAGAPALAALAAAMVVNARHLMYSGGLVPKFRGQPSWFRVLGPYFLIDQVFALSSIRDDEPHLWRAYYLGSGVFLWTLWQVVTGVGVLAGAVIPPGLSLQFAIPVLFIGLVVPTLARYPARLAAVVAVAATAATYWLPYRAGVLVGGLAGIVAGAWAEGRQR
jgi:predicted branched-subunit amino acid permease